MKFVAVILLGLLATAQAANWALLVAGSNTYSNYRHQADVFHAYQMLKEHGYPADHIVTMAYDDIASSSQNPVKGNVINHVDGPNVYPGSDAIDYKGSQVTPANFLKVLQGDKLAMKGIGSGKVIESTSEDKVFVFFSDHGAPGIIAFPSGGYLHASDLIAALKKMNDNQQYKEMVLYIEACESGSMFSGLLPENTKIYATTAANPTESSWACYWDATRNAYLGDTYSVNFLEDSDKADMTTENFQTQYQNLKQLTPQSHVMQYGDLSLTSEPIGNFLTVNSIVAKKPAKCAASDNLDQVSSRDVKIATLLKRFQAASETDRAAIQSEIDAEFASRHRADRHMGSLVHKITGSRKLYNERPARVLDHECLKKAIRAYENGCGQFDDYSLQHVYKLANLCNNDANAHEHVYKHAAHICRA